MSNIGSKRLRRVTTGVAALMQIAEGSPGTPPIAYDDLDANTRADAMNVAKALIDIYDGLKAKEH